MEHASGDKRFKILEAHMKKHQFRHDALIEILHKAQELFGYLEDDLLLFVAYRLKLPASRVYGVATFYHFFTLKPQGEHTCVVCLGTACYVKGADKVLAAVEEKAKIKAGETTPDNQLSLLTARCIGACGIAPAVVYDGTVTPRQTPETALEHVKGWIAKWSLMISTQSAEKERAARKKTVIRCCMAAGCMSSNSEGVKKNLEQAVEGRRLERRGGSARRRLHETLLRRPAGGRGSAKMRFTKKSRRRTRRRIDRQPQRRQDRV